MKSYKMPGWPSLAKLTPCKLDQTVPIFSQVNFSTQDAESENLKTLVQPQIFLLKNQIMTVESFLVGYKSLDNSVVF